MYVKWDKDVRLPTGNYHKKNPGSHTWACSLVYGLFYH